SERRRRGDLQAHQHHSQQQQGSGPSRRVPVTSQQQYLPFTQNLTPQRPPRAMSSPIWFPEVSNQPQPLSPAHGAPRVSTSQGSVTNTWQGSGINTPQGPGLNTSYGSKINTPHRSP
ncbi:unnamed protein product, partial [Meganyctiphanes norvegica]